jgi:shikimate kinase
MKIFLLGYMGSGKTTVGKKLAGMLDYTFIDLDSMIESETDHTIPEWFAQGEARFREVESLVLKQTGDFKNSVISTGGGTPCFHDNMNWMKEQGLTVYIKCHPGSLFRRLVASKTQRPLLAGKTEVELMEYIVETLKEREYFYSQAHYVVKGEDIDVKSLLDEIQRGESQLR